MRRKDGNLSGGHIFWPASRNCDCPTVLAGPNPVWSSEDRNRIL